MKRGGRKLIAMYALTVTVSALGLSIWDIGLHHGEFTRMALAMVSQIARSIGL